jgi:hypothetical protein
MLPESGSPLKGDWGTSSKPEGFLESVAMEDLWTEWGTIGRAGLGAPDNLLSGGWQELGLE